MYRGQSQMLCFLHLVHNSLRLLLSSPAVRALRKSSCSSLTVTNCVDRRWANSGVANLNLARTIPERLSWGARWRWDIDRPVILQVLQSSVQVKSVSGVVSGHFFLTDI